VSNAGADAGPVPPELRINAETVEFIVARAQQFQMQGESGETEVRSPDDRDPAYAEIRATIEDLEPDQQVDLVSLMWLGRGDYGVDEWDNALADAGDAWNERTADYLIGTPLLAEYLSAGLEQLGIPLD
jgi:hypothetical protein